MRPAVLAMLVALVVAIGAAAPASAHVAPAVGDNNRYLKLTPLGDRIRLAYTVFYGEVPGATLRRTIDRNHDGTIDDRETQAFGERIAKGVAATLIIAVDHIPQPVAWSEVVVGLGTPSAAAGAFSIDLVAWLCLSSPRGKHAVLLRDAYPLERPGETEVKVEDSPGVTIAVTRIGGAEDEAHDYRLVGPSGALETDGLDLQFTAGDKAVIGGDATCHVASSPPLPAAIIVATAVALAFVLAGLVTLVRRLRRHAAVRTRR
ncbi:MAG: hypothetical protein ABIY55_12065 [Kofleriaceae bacterium]